MRKEHAAIVAARYAADMEDSLRQLHEAVGMDPRSPDTDKLIARIRALSAGASGGGVPEWWSRFVANAAAALDKSGDRGMAARMMELHRAMTDPASPVTGEPDLTRHNPIMLPPHMKETQRRQIAEANASPATGEPRVIRQLPEREGAEPVAWECRVILKEGFGEWHKCSREQYDCIRLTGHYSGPGGALCETRALFDHTPRLSERA